MKKVTSKTVREAIRKSWTKLVKSYQKEVNKSIKLCKWDEALYWNSKLTMAVSRLEDLDNEEQ